MLTPNSYSDPLIRLGDLIRPEAPVFVDTKIMRSDAVNGLVATEPVTVGYCSQHALDAWNKISPELVKQWLASSVR